AALGDGPVALQRHDRLGRPRRAEHDVGPGQEVVELLPGDGLPAAAPGHGQGLVGAAVGDEDAGRPEVAPVAAGQLAHLAGADDQDRLVAEVVEDALDVIDGGAGDGDVALGDAGLGADAAGDLAGVAEQGVQQRAGAGVLPGGLVGLLDLAGDLAL